MMSVYVVMLLIVLATAGTVMAQEESLTLKYASLIFRHGDRSPVGTYPNDPYKREDWPQGYGQLSYNGTQQHFQLGRLIRKRYTVEHQLISPNYTRDEVYVRSTDFDRTLMSALSQLSGLFPPDKDQKLNGTIDWQPIPVHTVPVEDDNLLLTHGKPCPRYDQLLKENTETDYYKHVNKDHEQFFRDVEIASGISNLDIGNIGLIADTVFVESQWGRHPANWVDAAVSKTLRNLTNIDITLMFKESNALEKQRLVAGNLVGQIVKRMQNKSKNEAIDLLIPGANLVLYSGHDTTVAAFLSALQAFDDTAPPYAATAFVELYSDPNSNYFVRLWYLNNYTVDGFDLTNTTSLLIPKAVPNCEQLCPLDKFIELTAAVVPSDWDQECQTSNNDNNNNNRNANVAVIIVCIIGATMVTMMVIILIVYVCRRRRRYEHLKEVQ